MAHEYRIVSNTILHEITAASTTSEESNDAASGDQLIDLRVYLISSHLISIYCVQAI